MKQKVIWNRLKVIFKTASGIWKFALKKKMSEGKHHSEQLRRYLNGEMTPEEAEKEKHRASLGDVSHTVSKRSERVLPDDLKDLINRSIRLYERITKLDDMLRNKGQNREMVQNPLNDQMDKLQAAFGQKR